jgi:hypothetical protein
LYQGRERRLRDQVAALEARVAQLQADALELRTASHRYEYTPLHLSMSPKSPAERVSSTPERSRRIRSAPQTGCSRYPDSGTWDNLSIEDNPVITDRALREVLQNLVGSDEWERPGWKRPADENEGVREKAPARRDKAGSALRLRAQISLARRRVNVRAVPKIFPC